MIQIAVSQKGARADTVQKLVEEAIKAKYPDAQVYVTRKEPAESRADRFAEAQSMVADAKSEAESLKEELEEWKGNLPENLQDGDKASELDDAASQLDEFINACEEAEGTSVDFPGMF